MKSLVDSSTVADVTEVGVIRDDKARRVAVAAELGNHRAVPLRGLYFQGLGCSCGDWDQPTTELGRLSDPNKKAMRQAHEEHVAWALELMNHLRPGYVQTTRTMGL